MLAHYQICRCSVKFNGALTSVKVPKPHACASLPPFIELMIPLQLGIVTS